MPTVKEIKEKLDDIHWRVYRGFDYEYDEDQYGKKEYWTMPEDVDEVTGDCEDFALACRVLCREANIPTRLVICKTETGGMHCVLEHNGWILDNRYKHVMNRDKLDYTWIAISGFEPGDPWFTIKNSQ